MMKNIVYLALIGQISAIDLQQLSRISQQNREMPEWYTEEYGEDPQHPQSLAQASVSVGDDPIFPSTGPTKKLLPEIDVDAVMQNDLLTRAKVDYFPKLEKDIGSTEDSLSWAEKKLDHKLTADKDKVQRKRSLADRFDPFEIAYPEASKLEEDEDVASSL